MDEKLFEGLIAFINELYDETVQSAGDKRRANSNKAFEKYQKAKEEGTPEEIEKARQEDTKAARKLDKYERLKRSRATRKRAESRKLEEFRDNLIKRTFNAKDMKQAEKEALDAQLNQGLRNKLERSLRESLNISESCLEQLLDLIEGEIIDFQQKRKEKVLDRNAKRMAEMMMNGELNGVRATRNGSELIGDPAAIKKVKEIEAENKEVIGKCRKHG